MQIDIPTVLAFQVLAALTSLLVLASIRTTAETAGLREARLTMGFFGLAFAGQWLRATVPGFEGPLPMAAAVFLFWGSAAAMLACARALVGARRPARGPFLFVGVAFIAFSAIPIAGAAYALSAAVSSLTVASLLFAAAWTLARDGGLAQEPSRRIMVALLLITAVPLVLRAMVLLPHVRGDLVPLQPSLEAALAALPPLILAQSFGLAFVTMHRERAAAAAAMQAATDPLTGCLNRRALEERARAEIAYTARAARPLGVLMADLDHFKAINDTYGHAAGDAVLANAARVLRETVRPSDIVARYGGEEFCILFREADAHQAKAAAERLCAALRVTEVDVNGARLRPRASIGVAALDPGTGGDWELLFRRADEALYRAKRSGRDRVALENAEAAA